MSKYKKLFIGMQILVFQFLISSCDPMYDFNTSIYVDNKTDKEFLVYAKSQIESTSLHINANKNDIFVKKFRGGLARNGSYFHNICDIYIYSITDSTFVHFMFDHMIEIDGSTLIDKNHFVTYSSNRNESGKNTVIEHEFKYLINDSLLTKMTKNTALTDSIFNLKK